SEYDYYLLVTKDYKNELIDEYVKFPSKFISENHIFDFSNYDEIIVCQSGYIRLNYSNVYLFLKNNGVNKCKVIYKNNVLNTFNIKKNFKIIYIKIANRLNFYRKLGF
ncbi:MAG: hypothetical protein M0R03_18040, partial [Novosphingobium sp.]|nr:hypothetical protein [Novosphingobium sp.]